MNKNNLLISRLFVDLHENVCGYINACIKDEDDAKDLTQDVFLRLMNSDIISEETVKSFIFTIARNIVIDYIRHKRLHNVYMSYVTDMTSCTISNTMDEVSANDIQTIEIKQLGRLPKQRRKVYELSRFEDKTSEEIASVMSLSKRTVENHLFTARKEIRHYMAAFK
ncbi:MAG: sigma-70 family RNA polymerase sigma factor [Bacteroidales bacterium]